MFQPLCDYVCPLYVLYRQQGRLIGTGVPIKTPDCTFIATAAHVLEEARDEPLFTFGSERPLALSGVRRAYKFIQGKTIDVDLGIIILDHATWRELQRRYSATSHTDFGYVSTPKSLAVYVLVGYPYSKNKPTPPRRTEIDTEAIYVMSDTMDTISHTALGLHRDVHFTLQIFPERPQGEKIRGIPKMQGMSGGGVWRFEGDGAIREDATPKLVGLGTAYDSARRIFTCTRVQEVLAMLDVQPNGARA